MESNLLFCGEKIPKSYFPRQFFFVGFRRHSFYLSWIVPGVAWSDHQTHLLQGLAGIIFSSHQKVRNERQKKTTDCILLKFRIQFNTNIHVM